MAVKGTPSCRATSMTRSWPVSGRSATVAAAMESALLDVPAIAISLANRRDFDFDAAAHFARALVGSALAYLVFAWSRSLTWLFASRILAGIGGATIPVAEAYIADVTQTRHAIRRNYPVIGRFRYLLEHLDPKRIRIGPWLEKLDKVRSRHRFRQITHCFINRANGKRFIQNASLIQADDFAGVAEFTQRQADGTSHHSNTDNGNAFKLTLRQFFRQRFHQRLRIGKNVIARRA